MLKAVDMAALARLPAQLAQAQRCDLKHLAALDLAGPVLVDLLEHLRELLDLLLRELLVTARPSTSPRTACCCPLCAFRKKRTGNFVLVPSLYRT